eukprot:COSAG04_NODE_1224_length_7688_cov_2.476216_7_plen_446_part_00
MITLLSSWNLLAPWVCGFLMALLRALAALALALVQAGPGGVRALEAYTGAEPADARSTLFSVELLATSRPAHVLRPMVYASRSPDADLGKIHRDASGRGIFCGLHGAQFCNRSVSWVEMGSSAEDETVVVTIRSLSGPVFAQGKVSVRPESSGLSARVLAAGWAAEIRVPAGGPPRQLALEYSGSFQHAMLVFVGAPDPVLPTAQRERTLYFRPGVTHVPGSGVLQLPAGRDTILLARGAWLDGRINVTRHDQGPISVLGHGIISGRRFTYHGGAVPDSLRTIEVQFDRPLHLLGPTLVDPKGHALFVPPHSSVSDIKVLGWLYNEDGVWLSTNTTLSRSFVRTNDDSIRLYAGALDGFNNLPRPPRNQPARGVVVEDVVVAQLFNGAVIQLGWEDAGIQDSVVRRVDVIGAEWYKTAGLEPNDAVVSLRPPVYDVGLSNPHEHS